MTTSHLCQSTARPMLFGSPPMISADARNMNDLAQMGKRPMLPSPRLRLYYGRAILDPTRVGHDAGLVSGEVIYPLTQLTGSLVTVVLDIVAEVPDGIPGNLVRAITENGRKLKFADLGFAQE